jgi:hypothetical protein
MMTGFKRAAKKIRTSTAFRPLPPQSSASTSFATAARAANLADKIKKRITLHVFRES